MKIDLTTEELKTVISGISSLQKSAERAQTAKRGQPTISAVFEAEADRLSKLVSKLQAAAK